MARTHAPQQMGGTKRLPESSFPTQEGALFCRLASHFGATTQGDARRLEAS